MPWKTSFYLRKRDFEVVLRGKYLQPLLVFWFTESILIHYSSRYDLAKSTDVLCLAPISMWIGVFTHKLEAKGLQATRSWTRKVASFTILWEGLLSHQQSVIKYATILFATSFGCSASLKDFVVESKTQRFTVTVFWNSRSMLQPTREVVNLRLPFINLKDYEIFWKDCGS